MCALTESPLHVGERAESLDVIEDCIGLYFEDCDLGFGHIPLRRRRLLRRRLGMPNVLRAGKSGLLHRGFIRVEIVWRAAERSAPGSGSGAQQFVRESLGALGESREPVGAPACEDRTAAEGVGDPE